MFNYRYYAEEIVNLLINRKGFDAVWDDLDKELQEEILWEIEKYIAHTFKIDYYK